VVKAVKAVKVQQKLFKRMSLLNRKYKLGRANNIVCGAIEDGTGIKNLSAVVGNVDYIKIILKTPENQ
jgi:hypothetical protein